MSENFNYIAFSDWDYVKDVVTEIEMTRLRMFEYTPDELTSALKKLGPDATSFIEQLPTFLCSEAIRRDHNTSMLVKFGTVSQIAVAGKTVSAVFETKIDFGEVEFSSLEAASQTFGADRFQLYRTHWSVRAGDVPTILQKLAVLKPAAAQAVANLNATVQLAAAVPPAATKTILDTAGSVEKFLEILQGWRPDEKTETFFRGHEDAKFELTPSLLRKTADGAYQFLPNEDRLCKELLIAHYDEFQSDQYCFDRLVRMQHYSLPTRLLDISSNPLVALFFACYCKDAMLDIDGEVILFRVTSESVKYYDSDTVSCIANLSNLTYTQKNELDLTKSTEAFNDGDGAAEKLLHHIRAEKSFFVAKINPEDLNSIICVKAKRTNTRIKSQAGAFLLFGHEIALPEGGQDGIAIARVTITNKREILSQLDAININATTVYPSISETALHLRERYRDSGKAA